MALDRVLRTRPRAEVHPGRQRIRVRRARTSTRGRTPEGSTSTSSGPGRPVENAHIESFNGRLRDECLNLHWFEGLDAARKVLACLAARLQPDETPFSAG